MMKMGKSWEGVRSSEGVLPSAIGNLFPVVPYPPSEAVRFLSDICQNGKILEGQDKKERSGVSPPVLPIQTLFLTERFSNQTMRPS